jgi:hypothetical protein
MRDRVRLEAEEAMVPGGTYPVPQDMADALLDMIVHPGESGFTRYVGRTREEYLGQVKSRNT